MDGQQFAQHLLNMSNQAQEFINNDSPVIMGNIAVGFFKETFQDEGFTDNAFQKWDEVKRRGVVRTSKIQFESKIDGVKAIHNLATIGTTAFLTVHNNKRLSFYDSLLFYNAPLIIMLITHLSSLASEA